MENGAVSRLSSSTNFQQNPHYLSILMTNGGKMQEPAYPYLGSKTDAMATKESRTLETDTKTANDSSSSSSSASPEPSAHHSKSISWTSEVEAGKKQTIDQGPADQPSSGPSGNISPSKRMDGVKKESSTSASTLASSMIPSSLSSSSSSAPRNSSKTESSKPTTTSSDPMEGPLTDFDGSDLSDLSSASSASGSDHDSEEDSKEGSSADDAASDETKDDEEDEDESMEDLSASDDSVSHSKPKRAKGATTSKSASKTIHRRRIQSDSSEEEEERPVFKRGPGRPPKLKSPVARQRVIQSPRSPVSPMFSTAKRTGQWTVENADMENANPQTNGEIQPKKRTKQPDFANVGKRDRSGRTQLFKYTAIGDLETCRKLIEAGAQVNDRDNAEWTPLHEACVTGHEKVAELLIQHSADVNARGGQLDTPLHDAAQNGHVEVVKLLLSHGANVLAKNAKGVIPLDVTDDKEVIELLQRRQTLVNMLTGKNQAGQTLLHRSCSSGSYSNVVDLLNQGADIHARDNAQWTPLHEAALEGHAKVVELLLSRGADPNAQGHGNDTALHDSAQNEHAEVVKLLLEYGADPELKNSKGEKPCDVTEDDDILELLKSGARGTKKPISRSAAPVTSGSSLPSAKSQSSAASNPSSGGTKVGDKGTRYKEGSADVNMSDEGRSASEDRPVQMSRDERKMQQLLFTIRMQEQMEERKRAKKKQTKRNSDDEGDDAGQDTKSSRSLEWKSSSSINQQSKSKSTSKGGKSGSKRRSSRSDERDEDSDSEQEKPRLSRRSVQRATGDRFRVDHRFKDPVGRSQLHQWAESGDIEMVGTLLEGGADQDPKDNEGLTPLHLAARAGNTEVLVLLLAYGSDVNVQDHEKTTALHEAVRNHHTEAVRLLLQNNALVSLRDSKKRTCLELSSSKDTEIRSLLKASMEQAELKAKERSKKRLSQSIELHESPKHKERKTSQHSDSDEPVKSRKKDSDRRDLDERKQHSRNSSGSGTLLKSVSMPSVAMSQPAPPPVAVNNTHISSVAMPGAAGNWKNSSEVNGEDTKAPLKKQRPRSRRTSSAGTNLGMFEADDDVEMKPSGSSKKRRESDRNGDEYGGRVKIKKEREDDGQQFHLGGLSSKSEDLRRVASLPSLPKDNTNATGGSTGISGRLNRHASKPSLSSRPLSGLGMPYGSSVASISPPLTDTSTSPPPTMSSAATQELEAQRSRKRSSQSFTSASGYQKFADELKLVNKTSQHQRQRSITSAPSSRSAETSTVPQHSQTAGVVESEAARKKPKTSCTSDLTIGQVNGKPTIKEAAAPAAATGANGYYENASRPSKVDDGGEKGSSALSERVKKEDGADNRIPSQRSVQDAQRYLPLYTVQLLDEGASRETSSSSSSSSTGPQHLYVVDRQAQLLLGLASGALFARYPHLHRRLINKREKARLWSPLSSMVSDRCAAAVKLNFEVLPAECQFSSWTNATTAMSRLKEHEKQKFLGCELYFIRLEEVLGLIRRDYSQLTESMMTIMLDIGYDEEPGSMEVEGDSSTSTSKMEEKEDKLKEVKTEEEMTCPPPPPLSNNRARPLSMGSLTSSSSSSSSSSSIAPLSTSALSAPAPTPSPTSSTFSGSSMASGFMHKMRRVPAKMATKAMFKELQQQYRPS